MFEVFVNARLGIDALWSAETLQFHCKRVKERKKTVYGRGMTTTLRGLPAPVSPADHTRRPFSIARSPGKVKSGQMATLRGNAW